MSDVEEDSYEENTFDTDVEEDGDVEELANMLSKLQPYQYEPCNRERKSDGSESETTDNDSDTESDGLDPIETNCEGTEQNIKELKTKKTIREGNLDWCECLQCQNETREIDCLCCQEVAALNEKFDENSMTCITESTELQTLCLNTAVLKNVLTGLHDARGDHLENVCSNRSLRYAAYSLHGGSIKILAKEIDELFLLVFYGKFVTCFPRLINNMFCIQKEKRIDSSFFLYFTD